ncbi:MAG: NYN domain-containing protein [Oscillatoria sp. PMC 1068.18]|nr:NYN domain-containing protein [Oscillatoria sp. PMC 1076.18]MEC4991458.1 NYN domain-containing protein [Oscillatoria sp. PMC 1068.18]
MQKQTKCPCCGSQELSKLVSREGRRRYHCLSCGISLIEKVASSSLQKLSSRGIAVLLLDIENIKLDPQTEAFLASISRYPLQVKIAFANWKNSSINKHDLDFHDRGYQLIHVPDGKDSADAKMIAVGSSLFLQYPTVKEVFVCSSDWILTHLCNDLQNKGLTVYRVIRHNDKISIENRLNNQVKTYSLTEKAEITDLEQVVSKIENLIQSEHHAIASRLEQLSHLITLSQKQSNPQSEPHSSHGKVAAENNQSNLQFLLPPAAEKAETNAAIIPNPDLSKINSKEKLEKALLQCLIQLQVKSPNTKISLGILGTQFQRNYGIAPKKILKELHLSSQLSKFIQSSTKLKLITKGNNQEVVILQNKLS